MKQLDAFLVGKSLRAYFGVCSLPLFLVLLFGLSRWAPEHPHFAFLVVLALLVFEIFFILRFNPSEANKMTSSILSAIIFFVAGPFAVLLYPSTFFMWAFAGMGLLSLISFVVMAISFKKKFRDGIDTPYGECMWK